MFGHRLQEIKNWCTMILSFKEIINSLSGFGGFFCCGYASINAMGKLAYYSPC